VNWTLFDFAVFGAMLLGVGAAYAFLRRRARNSTYRYAAGTALAAAVLLVRINGAVGIIGSENNDANLTYFGVLAVALAGAIIARFRPAGMARAMYATALAQAAVGVIAIFAELGPDSPKWPADILILTAFFTILWLVAGRSFRNAARHRYSTNDRSALYPDSI
jgi:hypothetical protein